MSAGTAASRRAPALTAVARALVRCSVEVAGVATQFFLYDLLSRAEGNARRRAQASGMNVEDGVAIREEDVLRALRAKGIHAHRNEYFANEAIAPAAPAAASGTGRHQA